MERKEGIVAHNYLVQVLLKFCSFLVHLVSFPFRTLKGPTGSSSSGIKEFEEIPGPKPRPILGNILDFKRAGGPKMTIQFVEAMHRDHGHIFRVKLGSHDYVFISEPSLYSEYTRQEPLMPCTMKVPQQCLFEESNSLSSRGLFFQDGEDWKRDKVLITRLLQKDTGFMENIFGSLEPVLKDTMLKWAGEAESNNGGIIGGLVSDCYASFLKGMSALCYGPGFMKYMEAAGLRVDSLVQAGIELRILTDQLNAFPPKLARFLGMKVWTRFEEINRMMLRAGERCTELALESMTAAGGGSLEEFGLLHRFKYACKGKDEDIKVHLTDFIFDIMDPVSLSLMWSVQALGQHPAVQEKLYEELVRTSGESDQIAYSNLERMPYLTAVQKEIQRLYPVAPFLARIAENEKSLGGYRVPSGTIVTLSTIISQSDGANFLEPARFWPERWFPCLANGRDLLGVRNLAAYHPFGMGKRACPGKLIASKIIQLFILQVVRNFRVETGEVEKTLSNVLYPEPEITAKLTKRP